MNPPQPVSILIPTHNRSDLLERTLASIADLAIPQGTGVEVIVVANGCTDNTLDVARSWMPRLPFPLRVVVEDKLGLNHARNRAILEAKHDILAFLDDDVLVDKTWLAGLLDAFHSTGAHMLGGKVELWWEAVQRPRWMIPELEVHLSRLNHGPNPLQLHEPHIVGANFALKREVFSAVGEFRPNLDRKGKSLISGGETDFINRALAKGFTLWYTPGAALRHWVPPHRIELSHLLGIVAGKSASWLLMLPALSPAYAARSLVAGSARVMLHGAAAGLLALGGRSRAHLIQRIHLATGRGRIMGVWMRLKQDRA